VTAVTLRPDETRAVAKAELKSWPFFGMVALYPLWFLLGLNGFMWVALAVPMTISLLQRENIVVPRGFGLWAIFLVGATGSVISIDGVPRLAGWALRYGYYIGATAFLIYVLNGGRSLSVPKIVRAFTQLWMAAVVGGYLAFVIGSVRYTAPLGYALPAALLENDLINTLVHPSFADVQDILNQGTLLPRPKAPFNYTNEWGSMLALLTPFALMARSGVNAGYSPRLINIMLAASIVPAVVSLNRGLWLSLGVGLIYAGLRLGLGGRAEIALKVALGLIITGTLVWLSPLGDLIQTRLDTGHSNEDRFSLVVAALEGAAERPFFGWGAPRPNPNPNLPSVGTHGQMWFTLFSYGIVGAIGYVGFMANLGLRTLRQTSNAGIWANTVLLIGGVQFFFYLHIPVQMFTMLAAGAVGVRLQQNPEEVIG
jgi:hypothetical protein